MTHDTIADIVFVTLTLLAIAGYAVTASAGAPGPNDIEGSVFLILPDSPADTEIKFSSAEIRNAATVRADRMKAHGIPPQRGAALDIGFEAEAYALAIRP